MKRKCCLFALILFVVIAMGCNSQVPRDTSSKNDPGQIVSRSPSAPAKPDPHAHDVAQDRVPAFQIDAASLKNLGPTLPSEKFIGKTREAYKAVKAIPRTIAQLPCYCHCDEGFGHKSLYSCFEDDHAAHCAVCVDEALLAYRLEKDEKLKPEQIRERIIAQYSSQE
jgi:hypothetical protein